MRMQQWQQQPFRSNGSVTRLSSSAPHAPPAPPAASRQPSAALPPAQPPPRCCCPRRRCRWLPGRVRSAAARSRCRCHSPGWHLQARAGQRVGGCEEGRQEPGPPVCLPRSSLAPPVVPFCDARLPAAGRGGAGCAGGSPLSMDSRAAATSAFSSLSWLCMKRAAATTAAMLASLTAPPTPPPLLLPPPTMPPPAPGAAPPAVSSGAAFATLGASTATIPSLVPSGARLSCHCSSGRVSVLAASSEPAAAAVPAASASGVAGASRAATSSPLLL